MQTENSKAAPETASPAQLLVLVIDRFTSSYHFTMIAMVFAHWLLRKSGCQMLPMLPPVPIPPSMLKQDCSAAPMFKSLLMLPELSIGRPPTVAKPPAPIPESAPLLQMKS